MKITAEENMERSVDGGKIWTPNSTVQKKVSGAKIWFFMAAGSATFVAIAQAIFMARLTG
jgi:hypothetical protein